MKKNAINSHAVVFLAIFTLFTSCISSQSWVPVKGSGEAVDKSYNVSGFQGIEVSGGFDVILVQGNSEAVTLTAQENLFEYISVKVEGGMLKIYTENNIMSTRSMKARISFKSIDKLRISGGGDVTAETPVEVPELSIELSGGGDISSVINAGRLYGHISGGGDVDIDGSIKEYDFVLSGGGDIDSEISSGMVTCRISGGGNLTLRNREKASVVDLDINGGGDMNIEMNTEKMKCSVSGGGDATLTGQADELDITINGGGNVHAGNFAAHKASFQASGGSDIYVNASEEITGQISGGGDVYYSGAAERINIDAKGGSEIHKQ
ncbi:MAG: DUF2807 domain-containing protein [Bacteroidales bacterium]|nr:DUF2807 domain-containing protein [Bacteroidales bacterium]